MKILTVLGTRPEIIRLCRVIERLDSLCEQVLMHTGQNFDPNLNEIFFQQLGVRDVDIHLGVRGGTFAEQIGQIFERSEATLRDVKPDRLLVLGDTNSSLAAVVAKRMGIPVFHMEAGNRCYDDRVPEEVNRRIIDHTSDVLMPYTRRSRANLLREGLSAERICVTGNPIYEVMRHYGPGIAASDVLSRLDLREGQFFLVTMHRAENVDVPERLASLLEALRRLAGEYGLPVACSLHPHTRIQLERTGLSAEGIRMFDPVGFLDFIRLEQTARCVVTDSGTVQEECCILKVPTVTIRDTTERPETVECGSNMLSGADPDAVMRCVRTVLADPAEWSPPDEYLVPNVSRTVAKVVLGYWHGLPGSSDGGR